MALATNTFIADRIADELDAVTVENERTLALKARMSAQRKAQNEARAAAARNVPVVATLTWEDEQNLARAEAQSGAAAA